MRCCGDYNSRSEWDIVHVCVKVESGKKSYHQARKEEWTAMTRETHAKADPTKSQEEVRKFTARVERCNQETEKVQSTHSHSLLRRFSCTRVCQWVQGNIPVCVLTITNTTGLVSVLCSTLHKPKLQVLKRKVIDQKQGNPETNWQRRVGQPKSPVYCLICSL